ncbi:hypothetical protein [Amycolatopsis sp. NPDC058986]|uniref:hypothetical protein n=1 Tax=unclassified Amycolatopsis TaxID=2618356 RepID=UPI003671B6B5
MSTTPEAIVKALQGIDTVEEGAEYLRAQRLDKDGLVAVAHAALLTRIEHLSKPKLIDRILNQTITARLKFAGLRKW